MARMKLQGNLFAVSEGLKNQDTRGSQISDSQPTATTNTAPYVSRVESSLLEGETPVAKAVSLVDQIDLY
jgi:hypothetical protein